MKRAMLYLTSLAILAGFLLAPIVVFAQTETTLTICNEKSGLAWNMNTEADMAKYTIYHDAVEIADLPAVTASKIDVPHDPSAASTNPDGSKTVLYSLDIPTEGIRWFRVSASDTAGNESGLSNQVSCVIDFSPGPPRIDLRFNLPGRTR